MKNCPECNASINEELIKCSECGFPLNQKQQIECTKCHVLQLESDRFCKNCGNLLVQNQVVIKSKSVKDANRGNYTIFIILIPIILIGTLSYFTLYPLLFPQPSDYQKIISKINGWKIEQVNKKVYLPDSLCNDSIINSENYKGNVDVSIPHDINLFLDTSYSDISEIINIKEIEKNKDRIRTYLSSQFIDDVIDTAGMYIYFDQINKDNKLDAVVSFYPVLWGSLRGQNPSNFPHEVHLLILSKGDDYVIHENYFKNLESRFNIKGDIHFKRSGRVIYGHSEDYQEGDPYCCPSLKKDFIFDIKGRTLKIEQPNGKYTYAPTNPANSLINMNDDNILNVE